MRIACNARWLKNNIADGVGWFTLENLKRITLMHPEHEFLFLSDHKLDKKFIFSKNITPVVFPPPARHPVLWYIWNEWSLKYLLKKYKADMYFSSDGIIPISSYIPSLAVIHDINFHHRPKDLPLAQRKYYRYFFPAIAKKTDLIATVSEFSKNDISQSYGIDKNKIHVVYNGVNSLYRPLTHEEKNEVRTVFSEGKPYFIFIGSLHPRKNIVNLLKAFDYFRKSTSQLKLIIVGSKLFKTGEINKTLKKMKFKNDVIFTGRHGPSTLFKILGAAEALTYFSFFEGFGIPLAEAMYSEIPIIASNTSAIPEIAGNAALYADPNNVYEMSELMKRIINEKDTREALVSEGRKIRLRYNWDQSSTFLWELIMKLL